MQKYAITLFFPAYISIMEKATEKKNQNKSVLILETGPTFH